MNIETNVQSDVVFNKIIVPHDLSRRADKAVQMAGTMAHPLRSEVIVIHVIDPSAESRDEDVSVIAQMRDLARDRWRHLQIATKRLVPADVRFDVRILSGDPQHVILAEAKKLGADLLVITTHPFTGAGYPYTGGETEHIQYNAPCPVLAVPVSEVEEEDFAEREMTQFQTHSLKQYCDLSRKLSRTTAHRPVYLGYAHLPSSPAGVCK
jgi:nucleotide-binding universal stress UspA family protein